MTKNTQNSKPSFRVIYWIVFPIEIENGDHMSPYIRRYLIKCPDGSYLNKITKCPALLATDDIDHNSNFIATHDREEIIDWIKCKSELFTEENVFYLEYGDNEELIECVFQAATAACNHKYYIRLGSVIDANKTWTKLQSGELVQPDNLHIRKYLGRKSYQDISGFTELKYDLNASMDELDFFPEHGKKDPVLKFIPYTASGTKEFGFFRPMNEQEMEFLNLD